MDDKRVATGEATGMEDARENQNEEFGRGDQEFGGGPGEEQYGDEPSIVGREGVVFEGDATVEEAAVVPVEDPAAMGEDGLAAEEATRDKAALPDPVEAPDLAAEVGEESDGGEGARNGSSQNDADRSD